MELKLSSDLFLGLQELQYLKDSIKLQGYEKIFRQSIINYGVVKTKYDVNFTSLQVIASGVNKVTVKAGVAIDKNIKFIELLSDAVDVLTIPSDNITRYIIIKYNSSVIEEGLCNISSNGSVTGVGTKFISRLRGLPDIPSKISFPDSSINTGEYTVQAVQSDTSLALNVSGSQLTAESNKKYAVVGTFTPGISIDSDDKYPFVKDSITIELRTSSTLIEDEEFLIAEVKYDGTDLTIYDKRLVNKFTFIEEKVDELTTDNPLIGVETIKYANVRSPKDENLVQLGWGLHSLDGEWTIDSGLQLLTVNSGSGGIWSDLTPFTAGDFNGWKVVFESTGEAIKILTSTLVSGSIELGLEFMTNFPSSGAISIVPTCEFVELTITNTTNPTANKRLSFASTSRFAIFPLEAGSPSLIQFRHILNENATTLNPINGGSYINESSYDVTGTQVASNPTTYFVGVVTPMVSPLNFYDTLVPCGVIVMWSGSLLELPQHFFLCDGTNGTPDLRSRFIVGYDPNDPDYDTIGKVGGLKKNTLSTDQLPIHIPKGTISGGNHSHSYKDGFFAEKDISWSAPAGYGIEDIAPITVIGNEGSIDTDNNKIYYKLRTTDQSGNLTLEFVGESIGKGSEVENRPPYYALAFIMKVCPAFPTPTGVVGNLLNLATLGHYDNDAQAAANGVLVGGLYKASSTNTMGMQFGALKAREI